MNVLNHAETTMTPDEAEAIVQRLAERSTSDGPRIDDLAEALGVSREAVAAMLAEVRAAPLPKRKRRVVRRERRIWLLTGLAALLVGGGVFGGMWVLNWGPFATPEVLTSTVSTEPVTSITTPAYAVSPESQWSPGEYGVFLNGTFFGASDDFNHIQQDAGWDAWVERNAPFASLVGHPIDAEADRRSRTFAGEGQWERIVGLRFDALDIRQYSTTRRWLKWATASIPVYTGDDVLIAKAVETERRRRVIEAVEEARRGLGSGGRA